MKKTFDFDPKHYGPIFNELLQEEHLMPFGPGTPNLKVRSALDALTLETAFAPQKVVDPDMAQACLSAMWLYHDFLDESHQISQSISTVEGSYWHGIMHRREPDFSNSKYWFRRVGEHPIFGPLRQAAPALVSATGKHESTVFLLSQPSWDPFAFIDLCEACAKRHSPAEMLCRQIQKCEWQLLFDYCYHHAIGQEDDL
jgi:hypothetical protein